MCYYSVEMSKSVKIEMGDGRIVEFRPPLRVCDVLIHFSGHGISDTKPVYRHLLPNTKLSTENLYYLFPSPVPAAGNRDDGPVTINAVVARKKVQEMLANGVLTEEVFTVQIDLNKIAAAAIVAVAVAMVIMMMMVVPIPPILKWGAND